MNKNINYFSNYNHLDIISCQFYGDIIQLLIIDSKTKKGNMKRRIYKLNQDGKQLTQLEYNNINQKNINFVTNILNEYSKFLQ